MATEGRAAKKLRGETRTLELDDLSQFPNWVGEATDSELIKVFAIGVKVNESITIKITENPQQIKSILGEKLQPVYDKVDSISRRFVKIQNDVTTSLTNMHSGVSQMQYNLVSNIQGVANKVPSLESLNRTLDSKTKEVLAAVAPLQRCDQNLTKLVFKYENPAIKGALGEKEVQTILEANFPTYTITNVGRQGGKGDIHIESTQSGLKYLVEVKDHQNSIAKTEINRLEDNVRDGGFKVGILFSLRTGIHVKASQGHFTVKFKDDRYYIYVPNVLKDPQKDLIVWIVLLADQLAVLNQGLSDKQTQVVHDLLQEFQQSMAISKNCRTQLDTLKRSVKELERSIDPLLEIIKKATDKLNVALNKMN